MHSAGMMTLMTLMVLSAEGGGGGNRRHKQHKHTHKQPLTEIGKTADREARSKPPVHLPSTRYGLVIVLFAEMRARVRHRLTFRDEREQEFHTKSRLSRAKRSIYRSACSKRERETRGRRGTKKCGSYTRHTTAAAAATKRTLSIFGRVEVGGGRAGQRAAHFKFPDKPFFRGKKATSRRRAYAGGGGGARF